MRFVVQKIDERIKKLQEIRRIATDPEITGILSEFMNLGDECPPPAIQAHVEPLDMPGPETTNDLVKEVIQGVDSPSNGGLWSRRRGQARMDVS